MAKETTTTSAAEKKYLTFWNKVGYGSGDLAANMVYGILTSFVMVYLTDSVGLEGAIIGTLIMLSKFFDGFTDVIFGNLMDKTHTKMGKARPWMLYSQIGNSLFLVACFCVPLSWGKTAQYAFFFIAYTMLNAVFYTANNIAYAALTSLITRNANERVQVGVFRFVFALATNMVVANVTLGLVSSFGGGAVGWRNVAILYAIIGLIVNTISVMSVKELPPEEGEDTSIAGPKDEISIIEGVKILFQNKYFIIIALIYIFVYLQTGMQGAGVYFMRDVMGNADLYGTFSIITLLPMILGLLITPMLVQKLGSIYKLNLYGYILAFVGRVGFAAAGMMKNVPLMMITIFIAGLGMAPLTGTLNAWISAITDYTFKKKGVHVEGTMFSASSVGIKVGGGVGTALAGLLLTLGGYINQEGAIQPQSHINMMTFEYLFLPLILCVIMIVLLSMQKVEQANAEWDAAHPGMTTEAK